MREDKSKFTSNEVRDWRETNIVGVEGVLLETDKFKHFTIYGYAAKPFEIDVSQLNEYDTCEKIHQFQIKNFIRIHFSELDDFDLEFAYVQIKSDLEGIPMQNRSKAINNFHWVLDCWVTERKSTLSQIKYNALRSIVNDLYTELNISQEQEKPELRVSGANEFRRELSEFIQKEKESHFEFFNLFRPDQRDKIELVIMILARLNWIDLNQKWNTLPTRIGALNSACYDLGYFHSDHKKPIEKILCQRFQVKYVRNRRNSKSSFDNPKNQFINEAKGILTK